MKKKILLFCLYILWGCCVQAQAPKYWIFLKDKITENYDYRQHLSEQTIQNRLTFNLPLVQFTDIPLNQEYIQTIQQIGARTVCQSKWLNAVSAYLTAEQLKEIQKLPFVEKIQLISQPIQSLANKSMTEKLDFKENYDDFKKEYGTALEQMEAATFASENLNGNGVVIGVIDAGYYGAKSNKHLAHLFAENRILGLKDMLDPKATDQYTNQRTSSDDHGTTVLQMITGYTEKGKQYGFATKAKFYLARTDHGDREFRAEEDYWVISMEWMDSLGVRLINTSLGYSNGFDNPEDNYKPSQMDGKTSVVSRAVQIASEEKGLLIIVSAGNEGSGSWEIVSAPADAKGALSVGAVERNGLKSYYSSIGPEHLSYTKPNVACLVQISAGTSFSAPVITGFAACLMQKNPKMNNKEIFSVVEQSSSLYPYANNYIGYGVPKASLALKIMNGDTKAAMKDKKEIRVKGTEYSIKKIREKEKIIVFHKKNESIVIDQDYINAKKDRYRIIKKKNAKRTTIIYDEKVIEIIWE
ncbi:S8 family serine peptidase [Thermoflexibacter ruber]|uniref:Subtilase family protein n=1 Tax=Thermoflexibacter ruber TaxID=1003 RepID=A0A1I2GC89_9BACT|nr:S8 family serine peptidase [Thermoflexibacter ruber]SFF14291.1 Subtilase family protein [Thermoflexibacter ruber]